MTDRAYLSHIARVFAPSLWFHARDDVQQIIALTLWVGRDSRIGLRRYFQRELYRLSRELGYYRPQVGVIDRSGFICSVSGCDSPGMYIDPVHGRLCRRHGMTVRSRRKRGSSCDRPLRAEHAHHAVIPARNHEFWSLVHDGLDVSEWDTLWNWARGHGERPRPILEKCRGIIACAI